MSGVCAVVTVGARGRSTDERARAAESMGGALAHRGAVGRWWAADGATLLPLGGPIAHRGPLHAVADARLDRRADLARRLGLSLDGLSDADLLLAGWERWGAAVVERAEGDFAAVLWDERSHELVLLRDPLGIRPLYLARSGDVVLVASEIHALAAPGWLGPFALDRREAARYLVEEYAEDGPTLVSGIEVAQPGGVTRWRDGRLVRQRVWHPDTFAALSPDDPASCAERLREALAQAVEARLPGAGETRVLVSGGLDSSSVACLAARTTASSPTLLHLAFPGSPCDEAAHFDAVVAATSGRAIEVDPRAWPEATSPRAPRLGPGELYEATLSILEPLFDRADLPRGTVVLTGIGGDDLLHPTDQDCVDALRAGRLGTALAEARAWRRGPLAVSRYLARQAGRAFLPVKLLDAARRARGPSGAWPPWLEDGARDALHGWHLERMERRSTVRAPSEVQRRLALMLTGDSDLFVVMARLDRFAARRGLDLRHPFYDRRVLEVLLATPPAQRAERCEVKGVLREAMRGILPEGVRTRSDAADFTPWVAESVSRVHHDAYRRAFEGSILERSGVVRPGALLGLLDAGTLGPVVRAIGIEIAFGAPG